MDINEKEILENSIGENKEGKAKSSICVELYTIESADDEGKNISSVAVYRPIVDIQPRGEFVQIDLKFENSNDLDLRKIWFCLEKFGEEMAKDREPDDLSVPYLNLTILPLEYNGNFFWVCLNPVMWTLQPAVPGASETIIRILFYSHEINLFNTNMINQEEIDKSLERELSNLQYQEEQFAIKQEEEEAYLEERNRKIEEMRRKR